MGLREVPKKVDGGFLEHSVLRKQAKQIMLPS
jgi:hypothetical protein